MYGAPPNRPGHGFPHGQPQMGGPGYPPQNQGMSGSPYQQPPMGGQPQYPGQSQGPYGGGMPGQQPSPYNQQGAGGSPYGGGMPGQPQSPYNTGGAPIPPQQQQGGYVAPYQQQSYYKPLPEPMAYSQQAVYRPPGYIQPPNLKVWFDSVDTNRNGSISPQELQAALTKGNHPFSLATAEKVVRLFDKDRNGSIGYHEFGEAHLFCENMSNGFRQRDVNGNGELDGNEVREAIKISGYSVNDGSFQVLMLLFDRRKSGALLFDDYVELCIFLHNVRNVYGFYDRQQSGQVNFGFDAFLTAAVTLRSL